MDIAIAKFIKIVYKRDSLLKEHLKGAKWEDVCNLTEHQTWYKENIASLDSKIIIIADRIILEHKLPCESPKTLNDVYTNQTLNTYVRDEYYNPESDYQK